VLLVPVLLLVLLLLLLLPDCWHQRHLQLPLGCLLLHLLFDLLL
jgi:hypothetical protein